MRKGGISGEDLDGGIVRFAVARDDCAVVVGLKAGRGFQWLHLDECIEKLCGGPTEEGNTIEGIRLPFVFISRSGSRSVHFILFVWCRVWKLTNDIPITVIHLGEIDLWPKPRGSVHFRSVSHLG